MVHLVCDCGCILIPSGDHLCYLTNGTRKELTLAPLHQVVYSRCENGLWKEFNVTHPNNIEISKTMKLCERENMELNTLQCKGCGNKVATIVSDWFFCRIVFNEKTNLQGINSKKWLEVNSITLGDYKNKLPNHQDTLVDYAHWRQVVPTKFFDVEKDAEGSHLSLPDLECSDVREYQAEMYYQCLLGNSLIALPTGLGKTLVAVLLIKKLHEMNRGKLIAFVVNRETLAFQRSEYIERETNLECMVLTKETKSPTLVADLQVSYCLVLVENLK